MTKEHSHNVRDEAANRRNSTAISSFVNEGPCRLVDSASEKTVISGFAGSTNANYQITSKFTSGNTTTTTFDETYIQKRFALGVVASHEQVINNRTRLLTSAGLTRQSSKIGKLDNAADPSEPNHDENIFYALPVAVGVEFRKSDRTDFIGSVASNLYEYGRNENFDNDNGDAKEEDNSSSYWEFPATNVQFGVAYDLTPRLETNFVINKALFSNGLTSGLATQMQFSYEF